MSRSVRAMGVGFALGALGTAAAVHGQARVIYADAHAAAGGNGSSWGTAFRDLQDALAAAAADPDRTARGVEVRISQGVYTPDRGTGNRDMAFALVSGVTLMGGFAGVLGANPDARDPKRFVSVLSGDLAHNDGANFANYEENSRTIVDATAGDSSTIVDGFRVSGGNEDGANPITSRPAGVIATFEGYFGDRYPVGSLSIRNCVIAWNKSHAVPTFTLNGATLQRTDIEGNLAEGHWLCQLLDCTLVSCRIRGNRATSIPVSPQVQQGGALVLVYTFDSSRPKSSAFIGCLIADNTTDITGSLYVTSPFRMIGCTIAHNSNVLGACLMWAGSSGGGWYLRDTIIAANTSGLSLRAQLAAFAPNLDLNRSVLIDNGEAGISGSVPSGTTVSSGDPLFVSPNGQDGDPTTWQDNDYHLRPGSPAIDRADATDPLFAYGYTDLDNQALYDDPNTPNRGVGFVSYADLGCYEFTGRLCAADFNASGAVTVADIFDFLTAWFAGGAGADFDGNGTVAPADVFAFLNAWFAGC